MKKSKRHLLLIDPKVQVPLLCRVTFYWLVSLTLMGLLIAIQIGLGSPNASFGVRMTRMVVSFGPALITSVLLLPLLLFDCVRFSNRFAGPMHRLRREFARLADTGEADRLHFREGDFWKDLADQYNRIAERTSRQQGGGEYPTQEPIANGASTAE